MIVLRATNVGKTYVKHNILHGRESSREAVMSLAKSVLMPWTNMSKKNEEPFWAIQDIGFTVEKGDVLGVLGPNGAGKTTLLKVLSQVTELTTGEVEICGRVASLLGAHSGFHVELTARENIYLAAAIMGMTRKGTQERFRDIVEFAEAEEFLDTPIKHFSSGMIMKLGFSVAAHLLPEILILDEILAVGDLAFQRKAVSRTKELARENRTILFVSHNVNTVADICNKVIVLENGKLTFSGEAEKGIKHYIDVQRYDDDGDLSKSESQIGLRAVNPNGNEIKSWDPLHLFVQLPHAREAEFQKMSVSLNIVSADGQHVGTLGHDFEKGGRSTRRYRELLCKIPSLPLAPGLYEIHARIEKDGSTKEELSKPLPVLIVGETRMSHFGSGLGGGILIPQEWDMLEQF